MQRAFLTGTLLFLAMLAAAHAQYAGAASQGTPSNQASSEGAAAGQSHPEAYSDGRGANEARIFDFQPNAGVFVRSDVMNGVQTVQATNQVTELRVVQGRANVTVHHAAAHAPILVDLPGGQVSLLKDGFYTFNAATKTVRVLHGEALTDQGPKGDARGTKIKQTQQVAFFGNVRLKAVNAYPYELTSDVLAEGGEGRGAYMASGQDGYGYYGGYPYYAAAYGYPWGYGFAPYGYGYPIGVGVGFGYGGGFGGFRGGFRR